jgi:hypothetical protein
MDHAARCAFVHAQVACMMAELEAMKVANLVAQSVGATVMPYGAEAFRHLPDNYNLGWNTLMEYLRD